MSTPHTTVVHLLRHGEVDNPRGVLYGRLPGYHLSQRGRAMAEAVAEHLADHDITHVVSSPLERAVETATPIAGRHGLGLTIDPRVVEAGNHFEGRRFQPQQLADPRLWPMLANPFRPGWGERYTAIVERMAAAVDDARAAAAGHEAVIVTHQLPVWTIRRHLQGERLWHDPRRRECTLASLTSLHFVDGALDAIAYSEPAVHLLDGSTASVGA